LTANVRLSIDQETFLAEVLPTITRNIYNTEGGWAPLNEAQHLIPEVCGTIADGAHYGGGANGQDAYTGRIIPVAFDQAQITSPTNRSRAQGKVSPTINATSRMRVAQTLKAEGFDARFVGVRRLTPRECERLQGFPDDHTLVPHRGKEAMDGPRYRAIGNSMAVNVMRWIGRRIEQVEGER